MVFTSRFALLAAAALLVGGCGSGSSVATVEGPADSAESTETGPVTLEFAFENELQVRRVPEVADGTTLESLMRGVTDPAVEISGSGTTAFVRSIGDQTTESREGWTFTVDGEFATQGVGATHLHPPTTVRWNYGEFDNE
jgi:hypothetical protein